MSKQTDLINIPDAITVSGSNVGIGTSSPSGSLHLLTPAGSSGNENTKIPLVVQENSFSSANLLELRNSVGGALSAFDQSGSLGINTSSLNSYYAKKLVVDCGTDVQNGITIKSSTTGAGMFAFADGTSGSDRYRGYINYNHADDSMTLGTAGGAGLLGIDATGAVTMPTQPAFLARPSVGQTNLPNGVTTVIFDTEIFDQNSDFASNTFTAPVAGKYHLDANLWLEQVDTAISYLYLRILTSNRDYNDIISPRFSSDPTYWNFQCSVLADMDAGDTARVLYSQSGTSAQVDIGTNSFFSGYLVA